MPDPKLSLDSLVMHRERASTIAENFDLRNLPPDFYVDPYPVYDVLRETSPIRLMPDGSYFLTRHADLVAVYRDAQTFSSDKKMEFEPKYGATSPLFEHHTTSLVFNDPPLHARVRSRIIGALTRRSIAGMESSLITLVDSLLDDLQTSGGGDLIEDFASAIPVEVIGNLLGMPHADRAPLRSWSLAILGALEPVLTIEQEALGNRSVNEFTDYLKTLVAGRRRQPGNPEHDVLTRLIGDETSGEKLSEAELLQNCIFILNAGHETTTNLIGNALVALTEHQHTKAELLSKQKLFAPDSNGLEAYLIPVIDEFLRFAPSNQFSNRRALKDTQIGGVNIAAGSLLTLCIGAANRDPAQFEQPNELMLERKNNRHLAFGLGIHQCAGTSLARLEGRIAIGRFLQRFPDYKLTLAPTRGGRARFRGFLHAPFSIA